MRSSKVVLVVLAAAAATVALLTMFQHSSDVIVATDAPNLARSPTHHLAPSEAPIKALLSGEQPRLQSAQAKSGLGSWTGSECFAGAQLTHPKLREKCRAGEVAEYYCSGTVKCGQFASGRFTGDAWPLSADRIAAFSPAPAPRTFDGESCGLAHFNNLLQGRVAFSGKKLSASHCRGFDYYSPSAALAVLVRAAQNKGILFSGDSMMRQLFLRIIAYLRGEHITADHYFHRDGVYVLWNNGTDELAVLDDAATRRLAPVLEAYYTAAGGAGEPDAEGVALTMMFQWETKPKVFRRDFETMDPRLHIAAFMYWWSNKDALSDIDPYIAAVNRRGDSLLRAGAAAKTKSRYVYVTTPWTAPKTFGGVEDANRLPRNERAAAWILSGRSAIDAAAVERAVRPRSEGGLDMLLLDFAGIAATRAFSKTKDGIHYMCIWTPKFPELANNQKYNGNGCEDPMNLAVAQWLLHLLAFSESD